MPQVTTIRPLVLPLFNQIREDHTILQYEAPRSKKILLEIVIHHFDNIVCMSIRQVHTIQHMVILHYNRILSETIMLLWAIRHSIITLTETTILRSENEYFSRVCQARIIRQSVNKQDILMDIATYPFPIILSLEQMHDIPSLAVLIIMSSLVWLQENQ